MKLFSNILITVSTGTVTSSTEFVTVNRLASVAGVECPKTSIDDTKVAIQNAFNLTKWPNSSSRWLTGNCINGIGDIQVEHLANVKTNSGFYWQFESDLNLEQQEEITLRYSTRFHTPYEFVKGGKMPGLFGGAVHCGGGADAAELGCFSTRLMWRREGEGELYLYAPYTQADGFCDRDGYHCNFDYGHGVSRGSFNFHPGQWQTIEERVKLNTPGQLDGKFMLFIDGALVIDLDDVNYRQVDSIKLMGMHFNTFFGGSDSSWYPSTNQYIDFKDFAIDQYTDAKVPSAPDHCFNISCNSNASCNNLYTGYECICNEGFTGDGLTCAQSKFRLNLNSICVMLILKNILISKSIHQIGSFV